MTRLTQFEQQLLAALRQNSRTPVSVLAEQLGVSRATVTKTMARLENRGTIAGYTVRLGGQADSDEVRAITCIELESSSTRRVTAQLQGFPEIHALHTTNGVWDLIVELRCPDLAHFDRLLRRIRETKGVVSSQTSLLLNSLYP